MEHMTEEEAERLDELYTRNPPDTDPTRQGFFERQNPIEKEHLTLELNGFTARYIKAKAVAAKRTHAEIISDMVQRDIAGIIERQSSVE